MNKILSIIIAFSVCVLMFAALPAQAKTQTILQKNKSFMVADKKVESITVDVGDQLVFENADPFFHNIFSLSDLKSFDLGSYEKGKSKSVTFEKKGKVEVECAIHPQMFLEVTVK